MREDINVSAGDVLIEEAFIISPISGVTDLRNFIMGFDIYHAVDVNSITATFQITDATGLITAVPIIGQEFITVKFRTPNIDDAFHRTFVVHTISNRSLVRDREQRYTLECITSEGYVDLTARLTEKYVGSTDELAAQIYVKIAGDRVKTESGDGLGKIDMEIPDRPFASNNFEFIANHWSPFKCLNFLASRSRHGDSSKTNILFFERAGSYYFGSLESMIKRQKAANSIYDEYTKVESQDAPTFDDSRDKTFKYQSKYLNSRYHTIKSMAYPRFKSLLLNNITGFHATSIFSYDFTNKTMLNMKYDNSPNAEALAENDRRFIKEKFDDFETMGEVNTIHESHLTNAMAHRSFTPMNTSLFGSSYSRGVQQVRNELIRTNALAELENNVLEITIPGKTDVDLGLLVNLIFPLTDEKTSQPKRDNLEDPFVSGLYMITAIRHTVTNGKHDMTLRLMRDSLGN
jgi:hypothetical protein